MLPEVVTEKLEALPAQAGVYLFKDKKGAVLYVGKAKSLRSRVRSYFGASSGDERPFIPLLQRAIGDLETLVTANEKEAAILENNLIKEHRPRYNVKLRDDKEFITLRIATQHPWPRLDVVRRPSADGARYFGPYHSATSARRTLHLVNKHFQLRTCSDAELERRRRPCLQYQIKRCPAPCVFPVEGAFYGEQVDAVAKFLDGRHDELSSELEERMRSAARELRFELAAVYRDQLRALEKVREEQRVVTNDGLDRDVLGLYREGDLVELALLYVRGGKLQDVATFSIKQAEIPDEEIVAAFLAQHYARDPEGEAPAEAGGALLPIPGEIVVPFEPDAITGIAEWLSDRAAHRVSVLRPRRGHRVDLLRLADENARHAFQEKRRQTDDVAERLRELKECLRLPEVPRRIECCDISHLGGGDATGAIVAMADGQLDKKRYRTFHVRGTSASSVDGARVNDDYGAMYEVLARRFRRGRRDAPASLAEPLEGAAEAEPPERGDWELPDLFVVDGGRGQLAVALAAARDLGLHDLPIVALAKERELAPSEPKGAPEKVFDRVYLPGQKNPISLRSNTAPLFFLARLRDEAHRFSNKGREARGLRRRFHSALDDVRGLGAPLKRALLKHFGSVDAIRAADDAALSAVPGVKPRHVKALRRDLRAAAGAALPNGE